jgi:hypothetical protein
MKIPVYDPQINASTSQYNAVADIRTNTLGEIADGLQQYGKFREAQLEEERKTEQFKADAAIRYELDDAHSKMLDSIQNGGAYADAEAKYQKTFDETIAKHMPAMGDDPNVTERFQAEYKRYGLGQLVQLRNTIQQRRKSDVIDASNLRKKQSDERMMRAMIAGDEKAVNTELALQSSIYAGATSVGAITPDAAKIKIQEGVSDSKSKYALFQAGKDPYAAEKYLQSSFDRKEVSAADYISTLPKIQTAVKKADAKKAAYVSLYENPNETTDDQVDTIFDAEVSAIGAEKGSQEYVDTAKSVATKAKKLPPQVVSSIRTTLSLDENNITAQQADELSRYAMMVQSVPDIAISGMAPEDKVALSVIAQQVKAGARVTDAVKMTLKNRSEDMEKSAKEFATLTNSNVDNSKFLSEKLDWNWAWRRMGYEKITPTEEHLKDFNAFFVKYKNAGSNMEEARNLAYQDFRSKYSASFTMWGDSAELVKNEKGFLEEKMDSTMVGRSFPGKQAFAPTGEMQRFFDKQTENYWKYSGKRSLVDAQYMALNDVYSIWGEYDGNIVKRPPSQMAYTDAQFKEYGLIGPLKKAGLYQEGVKYSIGVDPIVEKQIQEGSRTWTYPILYENETGVKLPLIDKKTGKQIRTGRLKFKNIEDTVNPNVEKLF